MEVERDLEKSGRNGGKRSGKTGDKCTKTPGEGDNLISSTVYTNDAHSLFLGNNYDFLRTGEEEKWTSGEIKLWYDKRGGRKRAVAVIGFTDSSEIRQITITLT